MKSALVSGASITEKLRSMISTSEIICADETGRLNRTAPGARSGCSDRVRPR
jgi:hypothetical protein